MQIVSIGDNLHEMSKPVFWENKKKELKCHLLTTLPGMLSINTRLTLPCLLLNKCSCYPSKLDLMCIFAVLVDELIGHCSLLLHGVSLVI